MENSFQVKSKHPINVEVSPRYKGEPLERMIRRFVKRVKKQKILDEVRDRQYYEKPSTKRRKAAKKKRCNAQKSNSKR